MKEIIKWHTQWQADFCNRSAGIIKYYIYIAEGIVLLRFQPWVTGSVLSGSWENGGGLVENTFLTSQFVGQIWLMSDGRNLEPWSQEKSKIERKF